VKNVSYSKAGKTVTVISVPEAGRVAVKTVSGRVRGEAAADPDARAREIGRDLQADGWAEA
jgi:hypothetical protein